MGSPDLLRHEYYARMLRVVAYIDAHLDEDLALDVLAGVAAFSKFHFHRQFSALFGLGVGEAVQLVRLKRAAYDLAFRERSVLQAALDAGYESPESLARIFKKRFGQTPSDWRAAPDWIAGHAALTPLHELRRDIVNNAASTPEIRIVDFPETRVAVL
jgi:AraC family transcriptional regulator